MPNLGQTTSHKQRKFQLINWHTKLTSFKFDSLCYLSLSFHVPNLPNKQPLTLITKTACYPQIPWNTKNKIKTLSKKIQACSLEIVESHQPSSPRYTKRPLILEFLEHVASPYNIQSKHYPPNRWWQYSNLPSRSVYL